MNGLSPLAALYDVEHGRDVSLPPALAALYGRLQFPLHASRPYVLGNFVSTLDGVVTLNMPGQSGGGPISGYNPHDHLVMGLLRAVADAVIVGAGTLRAIPEHRWTAAYIAPAYAEAYQELRTRLGKPVHPLNVIVTARGVISLDLPVFQSGEVPVLLVTTTQGEECIREQPVPPSVQMAAVQRAGALSAQAIVRAVCGVRPCQVILAEGGPRLLGDFFAEQVLDELFLTLAPQIAGRDASTDRPGLVAGSIALTYLASWLLRLIGRRRAGIAVSTAGYLTALFSAYLGGELVFAKGVGVNHDAFAPGSDAYVAVMDVNGLAEGKLTHVDVAGIPAVLLKQGSTIYAIGATCTHQGGPLDEGTLKAGEIVQCPWHGSCFHLRDGSVVNGPAVYAQPTFAVRVRNNTIELRRIDHA